MSGGHFDYKQFQFEDVASMIDELVATNGSTEYHSYSPETIALFKKAATHIRKSREMAQRIDWLVSADDCEETFHERWKTNLENIQWQEDHRY